MLAANSSSYFEAATAHGAGGKIKPGNRSDIVYPAWQAWRKPLARPAGAQAVLLINLSEQPIDITVSYAALGLRPAATGRLVAATDAWTGAAVTAGVGAAGLGMMAIGSHDSVFLVLSGTQASTGEE